MYFSAFTYFALIGAALMIVGDAYRWRRFCWAAPLLVLFVLLSQPALKLLPSVSYDNVLLAADRRLGYDFGLGRLIGDVLAIRLVYAMLPVAVAIVYLLLDSDHRKRFGFAMLLAGVVAPLLYAICPAAGPLYVYGDAFPFHPPNVKAVTFAAPGLTMNAVPSGHLAWALLLWWNSRPCQLGVRIAAGLFFLGTAVATLATGEHYVVDLVVAIPFAVAADAAIGRRWILAGACASVVLSWSLALRSGLMSVAPSVVAVPLAAATVLVPLILRARIRRASRTAA
ncbi:MAG TPA: phosphatase PAP2 family protein [Bryobacteraceae bacterium]|nr:phosphatase PAP2 family protein [Bryobacteraceae bacterium]